MPKISKPMLASAFNENKARFPYIATPKIDGIRFLMVDGQAVSRSFKPIRNRHIQKLLAQTLPNGTDGELTSGDNFQTSTSGIMSFDGEPDFTAWIFDYVRPEREQILPFRQRLLDFQLKSLPTFSHQLLVGTVVSNTNELEDYEKTALEAGYEGVMLRSPDGTYKFGRASVNENILLKLKRFEDDEGELVGIEEKMSNQNPEEKDAFGNTKRSGHKVGMVKSGTCGALIIHSEKFGKLSVGSGLNDELRAEIWNNKEKYIGRIVKYKYFPQGVKDKPRHPIFLGWRSPEDMS